MITVLVSALMLQPQPVPPDLFGEKAVEEVGGFEMLTPVLKCAGKRLLAHSVSEEQRGNFKEAVTFLREQLNSCGSREATERISSALVRRDKNLDKEAADNTAISYVLMTELHLMEPALRHFAVAQLVGGSPHQDAVTPPPVVRSYTTGRSFDEYQACMEFVERAGKFGSMTIRQDGGRRHLSFGDHFLLTLSRAEEMTRVEVRSRNPYPVQIEGAVGITTTRQAIESCL